MRSVSLFGEDTGHEVVMTAFLGRLSLEYAVPIRLASLSVTGGFTRVHYEFAVYLQDVERGMLPTPDLIVVATDGNCKGYVERRNEIQKVASVHPTLDGLVAYAIPDPHVERWLLDDSVAFKAVLGKGCNVPQAKCDKNFYKRLLANEVQAAGVKPILGGLEYADELIANMNLTSAERQDPSLGRTLKELRARFNQWQEYEQ